MSSTSSQRRPATWVISVLAIVFGALTLKEGGAVIFSDGAARAAAGHYVAFVVWFNFLAGFAYIAAGVGLWMQRRWAMWLASAIAIATGVIFAAFGIFAATGGLIETRTVVAMTLRPLIWAGIAAVAWRQQSRRDVIMR